MTVWSIKFVYFSKYSIIFLFFSSGNHHNLTQPCFSNVFASFLAVPAMSGFILFRSFPTKKQFSAWISPFSALCSSRVIFSSHPSIHSSVTSERRWTEWRQSWRFFCPALRRNLPLKEKKKKTQKAQQHCWFSTLLRLKDPNAGAEKWSSLHLICLLLRSVWITQNVISPPPPPPPPPPQAVTLIHMKKKLEVNPSSLQCPWKKLWLLANT